MPFSSRAPTERGTLRNPLSRRASSVSRSPDCSTDCPHATDVGTNQAHGTTTVGSRRCTAPAFGTKRSAEALVRHAIGQMHVAKDG